MRNYAKECEITEVAHGVFEKTGIRAMAMLIGYTVRKNKAEPDFIDYLDSWIADVDGNEYEHCKVLVDRRWG